MQGGRGMMADNYGMLILSSKDMSYYDLQSAVSDNKGTIVLELCEYETKRSFLDAEWITFALMVLPAAESAYNITVIIKNEIKKRVMQKMNELGIKKTVKVNLKISLPFFLYEKSEEIEIEPLKDD